MSRRKNRMYKQKRAQEVAQKKARTEGNPEYKRLGPRGRGHRKDGEPHAAQRIDIVEPDLTEIVEDTLPSSYKVKEAYYSPRSQDMLVFYEGNRPTEVLGANPSQFGTIDGHNYVRLWASVSPKKAPDKLGMKNKDFWVGDFYANGRNLLAQIAEGWSEDLKRTAYHKLLEVREGKKTEAPKPQQAPAQQDTLQGETYVLFHDFPTHDSLMLRSVLSLTTAVNPKELFLCWPSRSGDVRGYHAAYFRIPAHYTPEDVAQRLGISDSNVRVGHFSDFGENFLETVLDRDSTFFAAEQMFQIAKITRAKRSTSAETKNGSIAYVFYHDEGKHSVKDVLVLSDGDFPKEVMGVPPEFTSRIRGYDATMFRFVGITSHELATSLGVDDALVRVGNYKESGHNYLPAAARGSEHEINCMLKKAKLPENLQNPKVKAGKPVDL